MSLSRRRFLQGTGAGVAGSALVGGLAAAGARADTVAAPEVPQSYPFHGPRQSGVDIPPQRFGTFAAFDATAADRAGLTAMFKALTDRARFLTAGGTPPDLGVGAPPSDRAVLGPTVPADGLTVTVSVGASLFDSRYGLRKPDGLTAMPTFPDDVLEPAWCHGDVMLQICANNIDTVHHALRDLTRHTRDGMQPRYRLDGFGSPPRPAGTPRNLLGFKDGISQPTAEVVWRADGSSFQVVRFIRMQLEFWDRVSISEQERMFGRRRDSGAPLDGSAETDIPDYAKDPDGKVIPGRLAHPTGQPPHAEHRAHPAPAVQLRPRFPAQRHDRRRVVVLLLPTGHRQAVRDRAEPAQRRAVDRLRHAVRRRLLLRAARRAGQRRPLRQRVAFLKVFSAKGKPVSVN
jgi:deferrochelatase/peroxidase EfeB